MECPRALGCGHASFTNADAKHQPKLLARGSAAVPIAARPIVFDVSGVQNAWPIVFSALLEASQAQHRPTPCKPSWPPILGVARRPRFRNLSESRAFDISWRCRLREWFRIPRVPYLRLVRFLICLLVQDRKGCPEAARAVQEVPAQLL